MCAPDGKPLFHPDVSKDMQISNSCMPPQTKTVKAEEIIYQGKKYYYTKNGQGISLYEYKDNLEAYVELARTHPAFTPIIEQLNAF
jgi:hypothetical protein